MYDKKTKLQIVHPKWYPHSPFVRVVKGDLNLQVELFYYIKNNHLDILMMPNQNSSDTQSARHDCSKNWFVI